MKGAILGDIIGSRFEFHNHLSKDFKLLVSGESTFTDDSVVSVAVAAAILDCDGDYSQLSEKAISAMQHIGRQFPNCGYGRKFCQWMFEDDPLPYNSCGNGSAMRISPVGFAAESVEQAKEMSAAVTRISHNHPEGMKGAEATAVAIVLARQGNTKDEIRKYIEDNYGYDLSTTVDEYRAKADGHGKEICQISVPQAFVCFLEGQSYTDVIRNCVSIGGDSDTIAAIAGGIAEAYYGFPGFLELCLREYLDPRLRKILNEFESRFPKNRQEEEITKEETRLRKEKKLPFRSQWNSSLHAELQKYAREPGPDTYTTVLLRLLTGIRYDATAGVPCRLYETEQEEPRFEPVAIRVQNRLFSVMQTRFDKSYGLYIGQKLRPMLHRIIADSELDGLVINPLRDDCLFLKKAQLIQLLEFAENFDSREHGEPEDLSVETKTPGAEKATCHLREYLPLSSTMFDAINIVVSNLKDGESLLLESKKPFDDVLSVRTQKEGDAYRTEICFDMTDVGQEPLILRSDEMTAAEVMEFVDSLCVKMTPTDDIPCLTHWRCKT